MPVTCVVTPMGKFYSVTDSEIIPLLRNYIGYGDTVLMQKENLSVVRFSEQLTIFYKDIKRVLYDNFKVKRKISDYDNNFLAKEIIRCTVGDNDNYYRNTLIVILKILDYTKSEIDSYSDDFLNSDIFRGTASYLHLLLSHIEEFVGEVATIKEQKDYRRTYTRKKLLAQEVFDLSRRLPKSQTYTNEMTHIYEIIFLIRQSIELKILESLYIEGVINEKHCRPVKVSPDAFIGLLADSSVKLTDINGTEKELDIDLIRLIHSWTNYFVHSGRGYWVWEVEFIRRILQDFIFANIRIDKNYLVQIPEKVMQCIKEDERSNAKVIMARHYYELIR